MRQHLAHLTLVLLLAACGGAQQEEETTPPPAEPLPAPEPAPQAEATPPAAPTPPPAPPEPAGPTEEEAAAAVAARAAQFPRPPIDGTRQLSTITRPETARVCRWMARAGGNRLETECPDGSHVTIHGGECNAESLAQMGTCTMTLFEAAACAAAKHEHPCEGGMFGEQIPECRALATCVREQLRAGAQQQQQTAPAAPAP